MQFALYTDTVIEYQAYEFSRVWRNLEDVVSGIRDRTGMDSVCFKLQRLIESDALKQGVGNIIPNLPTEKPEAEHINAA